ncbi:cell wall-binding protein YocH precursor [Peptococcaceae bacterium CEB3]|nr:cell wall-binding protein YocH precursor [Peptococcaceae bacterium CEB3]
MIVTAYTKNDKTMNGCGITASGAPVEEGVTIAAPPQIPFGTRIFIPALGRTYTVTDRGGAIRGDHLDLYMNSRARAIKFGRRRLKVEIRLPKEG